MYVNSVYHQSLAVIWVRHVAATGLSIILGLVVYMTVVWVRHAAADHPSIYLKIICGSNVLICIHDGDPLLLFRLLFRSPTENTDYSLVFGFAFRYLRALRFLVGRPHFVACGAFFAPPLLNMICYLVFYCHQMLFMYFQ